MALPEATRIQIMAPVVRGKKGTHQKLLEDARKSGYVRCRADGSLYDLTEEIPLDKNKKHNIEIVVDRLVIKEDIHRRLTDSVETAAALAGGLVVINIVDEDRDILFSQNYACEDCGISIEELSPPHVLLQQPLRRLSHLHRPGRPAQGGSRPHHPQQEALHPGGRHHRLRLEQHQG